MIRFACPSCLAPHEVSDRQAQAKFACNRCGQRMQVPVPPHPAPAPTKSLPPAPNAPDELTIVRRYLVPIVSASALFAVAGIVLLVLAVGNRKPQGPSYPSALGDPTTSAASTPTTVPFVPTAPASAEQAYAILQTNCYRCHGQNGTAEGGFNFILDREKLIARKKIVPRDAARSKLVRRIAEGEMPPIDESPRPGDKDVAVLKHWINEGAAPFAATPVRNDFVSEDRLVSILHDDLFALPQRDRKFIRYFTITHLANAHLSDDELQTYRHGLSKLINSLSWNKDVVRPQLVGPAGTILRVDIRDYSWNERVWSSVLAAYPHGVLQHSVKANDLFDAADKQLSHVRADWFVATASRPPLYHEMLQLPENERQVEDQLHIDVAANVRQERVARAGFNGSGVSRNNRIIERHESPYGSYWRSYDYADNVGLRNVFAHPLGASPEATALEPDGGEIIFSLPNGLQAFMLVNGKGRRLDKAPATIVSDTRRPDRAVENGVSCMSCHARGLIVKSDQVRAHVERNLNAFTPIEADTVRALYPPDATLRSLFTKDNERFRRAVEKTGARLTTTEPVASLVGQYEKELDVTTAAAELGLRPAELTEKLNQSAALARTLGPVKVPGGTIQRQVFNEAIPDLVRELNQGTYLAPQANKRP